MTALDSDGLCKIAPRPACIKVFEPVRFERPCSDFDWRRDATMGYVG